MEKNLNHYQLLGLEARQYAPVLSLQEVKAAYRRTLLEYHPDKKSSHSITQTKKTCSKSSVTVDDIALACKVLSEPSLRAEYDHWLYSKGSSGDSCRTHHTGLETIDLDDLSFDPESSIWSRSCRCGDVKGFIVSEAELERNSEDGELIVGCKGCSLWLRVLFSVEG